MILAISSTIAAALAGRRWSSPRHRRAMVAGVCLFWVLNGVVVALEPRLYRLASYDRQYTVARVADYEEFPVRPEVVFMGDSRVLTGFAPSVADAELRRMLGREVPTFNLAMTGARMNLTYLALKNLVREHKEPAAVVLGLAEFAFHPLLDDDRTMTQRFPLSSTILRLEDRDFAEPGLAGQARFYLRSLLPLYRDSQLLRRALSVALNPADPAGQWYRGKTTWQWSPDGSYVPPSGVRNPSADDARATHFRALQEYTFCTECLARLGQFLDLARSRGIQVVLVNMPVNALHRSWWRSPEVMAEYRDRLRDLAARHDVPLLDAYEGMDGQIPEEYFWDSNHLNYDGAALLTKRVVHDYLAPLLADP